MFVVNGCRKRNPFSTSLAVVVVVAEVVVVMMVVAEVVVVVVDTHDDSVDTVDWFRVCIENV
jgi:uncharacterized protein YhhL (DUF1145 family)